MNRSNLAIALSAATLVGSAGLLVAGPLNPPSGPVSSTYKTLGEIEPRIPLSVANTPGDLNNVYRITQPGSYYLTGNITTGTKSGISIESSGVNLDLVGFEISDANPVGGVTRYGIRIGLGVQNVCVRNGSVRNIRDDGIRCQGSAVRFEGLTVAACGGDGLYAENPSTVVSCVASACGGDGYSLSGATATQCIAKGNGGRGFASTNGGALENCVASNNTGAGFDMVGGVARNCSALQNLYGFDIAGALVTGCTIDWNNSGGIRVNSGCAIVGNHVETPATFPNILISGAWNRVEGNSLLQGSASVQVAAGGSNNFIAQNRCFDVSTFFVGNQANNMVGPTVIATGTITSTNPYANFVQ